MWDRMITLIQSSVRSTITPFTLPHPRHLLWELTGQCTSRQTMALERYRPLGVPNGSRIFKALNVPQPLEVMGQYT